MKKCYSKSTKHAKMNVKRGRGRGGRESLGVRTKRKTGVKKSFVSDFLLSLRSEAAVRTSLEQGSQEICRTRVRRLQRITRDSGREKIKYEGYKPQLRRNKKRLSRTASILVSPYRYDVELFFGHSTFSLIYFSSIYVLDVKF